MWWCEISIVSALVLKESSFESENHACGLLITAGPILNGSMDSTGPSRGNSGTQAERHSTARNNRKQAAREPLEETPHFMD